MEAANEPLLWITLLIMLLGLVGGVMPGLAGVPLIFTSALPYSYLTGFETVGAGILVLPGLAQRNSLRARAVLLASAGRLQKALDQERGNGRGSLLRPEP